MIALIRKKTLCSIGTVTSYFCDGWERKGWCWIAIEKVTILNGLISYYTFSSGVPKVVSTYDSDGWGEHLWGIHKQIKEFCKGVIARIKCGEIDEALVQDEISDEFDHLVDEY